VFIPKLGEMDHVGAFDQHVSNVLKPSFGTYDKLGCGHPSQDAEPFSLGFPEYHPHCHSNPGRGAIPI